MKTQNIVTSLGHFTRVFLVLSLFLGTLSVFAPKAEAAGTCYTNIGPLRVEPSTTTCTSDASGRKVYLSTTGATIQPDDPAKCFVGTNSGAGGSFASTSYQEASCTELERLRQAEIRNRCTASGGTQTTQTGGQAPVQVCSCPSDLVFNSTTYQCGSVQATTGASGSNDSIPTAEGPEVDCLATGDENLNDENCGIVALLNTVFNFVSGGIAIAVIINIIYAGIQYSTAQGDPSNVNKAKTRIRNAVLAFLMYVSLYAFIQWLIPGGVF